jgi:hypothetical protein
MQWNCLIEDRTVEVSVTTRMYPAMEVSIPEIDNNGFRHNIGFHTLRPDVLGHDIFRSLGL